MVADTSPSHGSANDMALQAAQCRVCRTSLHLLVCTFCTAPERTGFPSRSLPMLAQAESTVDVPVPLWSRSFATDALAPNPACTAYNFELEIFTLLLAGACPGLYCYKSTQDCTATSHTCHQLRTEASLWIATACCKVGCCASTGIIIYQRMNANGPPPLR